VHLICLDGTGLCCQYLLNKFQLNSSILLAGGYKFCGSSTGTFVVKGNCKIEWVKLSLLAVSVKTEPE
jgi:hypothetical protein